MDSWHQGRVALLGDAAFAASALSGQGSSLALVGAYVLAGELAAAQGDQARGDHEIAFARYESELREFVAANQDLANGNAERFAPATDRAIRMQNLSLKMLRYLPGKRLMMKAMTKGVAKAAKAITIRDYAALACSDRPKMVQPTR
jgi:2-polyprenyl-6-methoxyphenol hydroxylase-like FAD-dependent oxidoreductase